MNEKQIERLLKVARGEPAPVPPENLERRVMRALHQVPPETNLADQLSRLLPRLTASTALMIVLCGAADVCLANLIQPDLDSGLTQLAEEWLFAAK